MIQRISRLLLAVVLLLAACTAKSDGLVAELGKLLAESGLALIANRGDWIAVLPFDGPERYFKNRDRLAGMAVSSGGSAIAWSVFRLIPPGGSIVVYESIQGQERHPKVQPPRSFWISSFNEKRDRIAYLMEEDFSQEAHLHWSSMDFASDHIDVIGRIELEMTWSPDGRVLAYEQSEKIALLDTTTGSSKNLVAGHSPNWSPDGKWISYRAIDGLHWSPDGKLVAFSVTTDTSLRAYRLLVGRVSDGEVVTVREFGPNNPDVDKFRWIVDYTNFCRKCKPGIAFN